VHVEYDATFHEAVPIGAKLRVAGRVSDRIEKRGRTYVYIDMELRAAEDDRLLISYRDTVTLSYRETKA